MGAPATKGMLYESSHSQHQATELCSKPSCNHRRHLGPRSHPGNQPREVGRNEGQLGPGAGAGSEAAPIINDDRKVSPSVTAK